MAKSISARKHITARVPERTVQQMEEIRQAWVSNIPGTEPSQGDVIANAVDALHKMLVPAPKEETPAKDPSEPQIEF